MALAGTPLRDRHEAVRNLMVTLQPNPRLDGVALDIATSTWELAVAVCGLLNDGPELAAGLRKLREAKDCLVIQGLADSGGLARLPGDLPAPIRRRKVMAKNTGKNQVPAAGGPAKGSAADPEAVAAGTAGKPQSQIEAENPPDEVLEQEALEREDRMPGTADGGTVSPGPAAGTVAEPVTGPDPLDGGEAGEARRPGRDKGTRH
jgi:hypothetical protein